MSRTIDAFKEELSGEKEPALEAEVRDLEIAIARQRPEAIQAVTDYRAADAERKTLDKKKTEARAKLDKLMATTLEQYQDRINAQLDRFGAGFSVAQLKATYQGSGQPRTEYVLRLRRKTVPLGTRRTTGAHFGSTLSEGDKRTLAFAFFLARITADSEALRGQVLVIDDPVSSLDRSRRAQTVESLAQLATACSQMIVMSHDAFFLREQRDKLLKVQPRITPIIAAIERTPGDSSAFGQCSLDELCASDYYRHHRQLTEYVEGRHKGHLREVAKAIRPFLEGFYHRRFPGLLPSQATFGTVITVVSEAPEGSPLSHLQPRVPDLHDLNDYASRFHHDTNPGTAETTPVTDGELKVYVGRALELVYRG